MLTDAQTSTRMKEAFNAHTLFILLFCMVST